MATAKPICKIDGCNKPSLTRGWCSSHYRKLLRYGDPLAGRATPRNACSDFIARVVASDHSDECVIWPFARFPNGYAKISGQHAGRVVCEAAHGAPTSAEMEAAHSCGNGHLGCVNPRHLSWKTARENAADRLAHKRDSRGEKSPHTRLRDSQVLEIRALLRTRSMTHREIGRRFGVTVHVIDGISRKRTWAWLK